MKNVRTLFRKFSQIDGFDGWMIGKLCFQFEEEEQLPLSIRKQKENYAVLEAASDNLKIQMHILKPQQGCNRNAGFVLPEQSIPVSVRKFTGEEILSFVSEVEDDNWIHRTKNPVVPGFLMAEWLFESGLLPLTASSGEISMIFRAPAYAWEEIAVYGEDGAHRLFGVTEQEERIKLLWELIS